ncbi:BMP family ABC transporter substrate-binding protein [Cellvibrio japonicus]|uniref:Bmp family protein n=1 Tax=Cellvibrio japonicus (strain Ueda107) TaxID=498211 RepID=B3PJ31_CELJU|nr:BMP family ABC transporter substrate-binding protein [Cellvibrio japonicus]ACE84871.1 bmp family protein [Cellvibrio japonicus Ueda107]QEI11232.1 BMP family ABC transporter substrate-binding protein [Cellvibrio japonicus]QEI14806.1 BMP family ABC transporter substrate-binding protein [Cellvibrio japonicus]QEI18386.1 BMP family ABC transporter substrate-binding protein [Cellvibrio japonicus]
MTLRVLLPLAAALLSWTSGAFAAPLKVGFVYVSPIGDAGWTYQHDEARKIVQQEFADKIETTYVESVAEGADAERVIRNMASRGYDLIFTTSFGYMNPTLKVAKMYPKVKFEHATGYKTAPNMGNYQARDYQGRYLAGMVAGAMSQKGVIGYVGAFPIPEVIRGINSFMLGAQQMNPDVTMKVVWVNTWHDPAKEREAAESLILQGADVLTMHTDSAAVIQAAEARAIYSVGFNSDMRNYGPKTHLTASTQHWESIYRTKIQQVIDGTWQPEAIWHGLKEGVVGLSPMNEVVPKEVVAKVEQYKMEIINGSRDVYQGPIYDQAGTLKVEQGKALDDEALHKQDWYVKGIDGKIPK